MAGSRQTGPKTIFVLSDATGATGERIVRAMLTQFHDIRVELNLVRDIKRKAQLKRVVSSARKRGALIAYTLVNERLREEVTLLANEAGVASVDLIGPLLTALGEFFAAAPAYKPGLYLHPSEEQYRHLDATAFTVRHDDGQGRSDLKKADIVIVGPSRTSKTPLSVYLAHTRGLKIANVPLAMGIEPFQELEGLGRHRVAALTMKTDLLCRVRMERVEHMGATELEYASPDYVGRELRFCHEIYRKHPNWAVVDVTGRSIEEIAASVRAVTVDARRRRGQT